MKPPEKERARLGTGLRRDLNDSAEYQSCARGATITHPVPQGHTHYAAEYCASCGAFVRWLPKPETIERKRLNDFRLARLAMCSRLNPWESSFVRDVSKRRKLSPKQSALVERLAVQHLEAKAP